MATVLEPQANKARPSPLMRYVNDTTYRAVFYQIALIGVLLWLGWFLVSNAAANLEARGMSSGFGFLGGTAGFQVAWSIIPYDPSKSYFHVYLVGITNTLLVSAIAIAVTTVLGFFVGIMRLSKNWLIATVAGAYVEVIRNTPLLLQVIFWYIGVFSLLPRPKQSIDLLGLEIFQLNNRGLYFPQPQPGDDFWMTPVAVLVAIAVVYALAVRARRVHHATGHRPAVLWPSLGIAFGLPLLVFVLSGAPLAFSLPELKGFNFTGGSSVPPAFCALFVALVVYTATYIGEAVRAGIQSVHVGQNEAAYALGLRPGWIMRLVVIPQAMRASTLR